MSSHRTWMGLALAAVLVAPAVLRGADDPNDADVKKLQGKWSAPSGNGGKTTYTFNGRKLKVEAPSRTYQMTVTIDAAAKPEKSIDFKIDDAPDEAKGKVSKGIYKFDGDNTMIFCFRPEGERPAKYEMVGFEQIVVELKREKD